MENTKALEVAQRICQPSYFGGTRADDAQHILDVAKAIDEQTAKEKLVCDNLATVLALAIRQNRCDMILTGDELRQLETAFAAYIKHKETR